MDSIRMIEASIQVTETRLRNQLQADKAHKNYLQTRFNNSSPTLLMSLFTSFFVGWGGRKLIGVKLLSYPLIKMIMNVAVLAAKR